MQLRSLSQGRGGGQISSSRISMTPPSPSSLPCLQDLFWEFDTLSIIYSNPMSHYVMVSEDTVHMVTNFSPFGRQVRLTLYIAIVIYLITPLFLFFSLFYTTDSPRKRGKR